MEKRLRAGRILTHSSPDMCFCTWLAVKLQELEALGLMLSTQEDLTSHGCQYFIGKSCGTSGHGVAEVNRLQ